MGRAKTASGAPACFLSCIFRAGVLDPLARGCRRIWRAEGQAVVCPLLRGSSPTRWVAPKQHRGLRRAFSPAFFALVFLIPWPVGAEESGAPKDRQWSARCYGVARQRDGSRQNSIGGAAFTLSVTLTRARALLATPWSARCY